MGLSRTAVVFEEVEPRRSYHIARQNFTHYCVVVQLQFPLYSIYHDWSNKEWDAAACAGKIAESLRKMGVQDVWLQ